MKCNEMNKEEPFYAFLVIPLKLCIVLQEKFA